MLDNSETVTDVALKSAFEIPMMKTSSPRRFFLTAQGLHSALNQGIGWWQMAHGRAP